MLGRKDPRDQVGLDGELVARFDADEIGLDPGAVQLAPGLDDLPDRPQQVGRGQDRARRLPAKLPMRQVIRDAGRMVHVAVRQQDMVDGNQLVRGLADVKTDIELRHRDHRLFAADGVPDDVQIVKLYLRQLVAGHSNLFRQGQVSVWPQS